MRKRGRIIKKMVTPSFDTDKSPTGVLPGAALDRDRTLADCGRVNIKIFLKFLLLP
jgi:hypothetical protein